VISSSFSWSLTIVSVSLTSVLGNEGLRCKPSLGQEWAGTWEHQNAGRSKFLWLIRNSGTSRQMLVILLQRKKTYWTVKSMSSMRENTSRSESQFFAFNLYLWAGATQAEPPFSSSTQLSSHECNKWSYQSWAKAEWSRAAATLRSGVESLLYQNLNFIHIKSIFRCLVDILVLIVPIYSKYAC